MRFPRLTFALVALTGAVAALAAQEIAPADAAKAKKAVKKVDGVTGDTAKPKTDSMTVTGNFDGAELVKALNAAGFHVKVKQ